MIDIQSILATMYKDACSVVEHRKITDPITKKTGFDDVTVVEDQPCRLSYKQIPTTAGGNVASMDQQVKVFLPPEVEVKAGSKVIVTQHYDCRDDIVTEYAASGVPAVYPSHQEVSLELFERWA